MWSSACDFFKSDVEIRLFNNKTEKVVYKRLSKEQLAKVEEIIGEKM